MATLENQPWVLSTSWFDCMLCGSQRCSLTFDLFLFEHLHSSVLRNALVTFVHVLGEGRSSDMFLLTQNSCGVMKGTTYSLTVLPTRWQCVTAAGMGDARSLLFFSINSEAVQVVLRLSSCDREVC